MKPNNDELAVELTEINSSRRGFFSAVTRGVATSMEEPKTRINVGRPLGAVEESLFNRLCNQCGECAKSCPQSVISMTARGPEMDLSLNHCTFCQACINACQVQALNPLNSSDTGWRPTVSHSCNSRIFGNCEECQDDCPREAIQLQAKQLPTINDNCNGCGECVSSCYIGAISLVAAD